MTDSQKKAASAFWLRVAKAHDQHGQTKHADAARDHAEQIENGGAMAERIEATTVTTTMHTNPGQPDQRIVCAVAASGRVLRERVVR